MRKHKLVLMTGMLLFMEAGCAQMTCDAPVLSNEQVKAIIDKERSTRKDLPAAFPEYRWLVRRDGCGYVYIEYGLPATPDYNHIIRLNQDGIIIDARTGNE